LVLSLRSSLAEESSTEEETLRLYSNAACIYEVRPRAVVWPRDTGDVETLLGVCRQSGVPLTARGAGSGVAGHALGTGVIADFSRHMNRVLEINAGENWVRVQPGVVLGALNEMLKAHGKHFSPDPSSGAFCTIGGMIANNAGGPHSVRYGSTREHVLSLTAITGSGAALVTKPVPRGRLAAARGTPRGAGAAPAAVGREPAGAASAPSAGGTDENERLAGGLLQILDGREELLERYSMRTSRNSSGYDLRAATEGEVVDLGRLLAGSEGTLALVTEAKLRLRDLPAARGTALLLFDDLMKAGEAIRDALADEPSCIELMSQPLLRMVRAQNAAVASIVPESTRALVILECDGDNAAEAAG